MIKSCYFHLEEKYVRNDTTAEEQHHPVNLQTQLKIAFLSASLQAVLHLRDMGGGKSYRNECEKATTPHFWVTKCIYRGLRLVHKTSMADDELLPYALNIRQQSIFI